MKKKLPPLLIALIGVFLVTYGLISAPVSNTAEIVSHYECNRITKDLRSTDKYCASPSSAPEAKKNFGNTFVYSGTVMVVIDGFYAAMINKAVRSKN